jgi:hypothetical protein
MLEAQTPVTQAPAPQSPVVSLTDAAAAKLHELTKE